MAWGDSLLASVDQRPLSDVIPNWDGSKIGEAGQPTDWESVALGLMVAGGVTSAVDTYNSYRLKGESLRGQSAAYASNAQMAELAAQQAQRAGEAQIAQITYRAGQVKAKQRAGFAANGVAVGVGSSAETLASTEAMKQIDVQTAKMNALMSSWGYRRQAANLLAQSKGAQIVADANDSAAGFGAFGSLIGTASRVAGAYYLRGAV